MDYMNLIGPSRMRQFITHEKFLKLFNLAENAVSGYWWLTELEDAEGESIPGRVGISSPEWGSFAEVITEVDGIRDEQGIVNAEYIEAVDPQTLKIILGHLAHVTGILREITDACEKDCGVPTDEDGDDEPVGLGDSGPMALTFGMLRRAREAANVLKD